MSNGTEDSFANSVDEYLKTETHVAHTASLTGVAVCDVCRGMTHVDGGSPSLKRFSTCYQCSQHLVIATPKNLAQHCGFIAYALSDEQLAVGMRAYRNPQHPAAEDARGLVASLLYTALRHHLDCLINLSGSKPSVLCHVPSTANRQGTHPLTQVIDKVAEKIPSLPPRQDILETAHITTAGSQRDLTRNRFFATLITQPDHVLVIDDTWTQGGHAQSAAWALHSAGVATVSVLCAARWLSASYSSGEYLYATVRAKSGQRPFASTICPWTATGKCP